MTGHDDSGPKAEVWVTAESSNIKVLNLKFILVIKYNLKNMHTN